MRFDTKTNKVELNSKVEEQLDILQSLKFIDTEYVWWTDETTLGLVGEKKKRELHSNVKTC